MTTIVETVPQKVLPKYTQAQESKFDLDWADLITLDLSQFDTPGGQQKLATQLRDAVHNVGFFYITDFGLSQEEVDQQFAIAKEIFALPLEEKLKYRAELEDGHYNGYRPLGMIEQFPGLRDNFEMYNIFKFLPQFQRDHPNVVNEHIDEIEKFQRHVVENIVRKLLILIALVLEVPPETLLNGHRYSDNSDCHLRYMVYRARTAEENAKFANTYAKGHTDFGSLTLLFRQPVAALQVRMPDDTWKWVKPYPGSITVNIADMLQFWSNGYLKSSVHRVTAPPPDQVHLDRLGVLYMLRPGHDLEIKPLQSSLLQREGAGKGVTVPDGITAGDWVRARVKKNLDKPTGLNQKEVIGGVSINKYYD